MKMIDRTEKYCPRCKLTKPIAEFHKNKSRYDGVSIQCNICENIRGKNYHKNGAQYQNSKTCAQYFGGIAEKILEKAFKNAQMAKFGTKGYDLTCAKGRKVDSKVSTFRKKSKSSFGWFFKINRNKTAEWFACFAFDNRTSLTPLHFWLIPSEDVNHLHEIGIFPSTLYKWEKYEQPLDKIELACSIMKGEPNGD